MNIYNVKMLVKYVLICDIFWMIARLLFVLEKGYFLKKYQQFSINFIFVCLFVFCDLYGFLPRIVHSFKHIFFLYMMMNP